jgi:hypothetical protein
MASAIAAEKSRPTAPSDLAEIETNKLVWFNYDRFKAVIVPFGVNSLPVRGI